MKTYNIALIPGDGIGTEVIGAGVSVLKALQTKLGGFELSFTDYPYSVAYYKEHGEMMPTDGMEKLRKHDAIYFGACGLPAKVPDHISLWGLILPIRKHFQQYVNLRPVRILKGSRYPLKCKPEDIDW